MEKNSVSSVDLNYTVSLRKKLLLMSLLFILNIVVRIPSIPHEKGYDSFFIHSLANYVSYFGEARWWINWMSVFGLYPYSYASSVPFSLSGISQLTGISMEITILLFCFFLGLISIFTSYIFIKAIYNNFIPCFVFAFLFSLSAGTMNLTTWEITTRAQFLVYFPLLMYTVLKSLRLNKKFWLLMILSIIFIFATHHYAYFAVFFSLLCALVFLTSKFYKMLKFDKHSTSEIKWNFFYLILILIVLCAPFFMRDYMGFIKEGSRYSWISSLIVISIRNLGLVFPFSIGGFFYLTFEKNKKLEEWMILICLIPTFLFSYNKTYGYIITYLFMIIVGASGVLNLIQNYKPKRKLLLAFIIIFLTLNVSFSCFFNHWRLGISDGYGYSDWYMKDETAIYAKWIKQNIDNNKIGMSSGYETFRAESYYGSRPILFSDDVLNYINGLITLNESRVVKNSVFSSSYYFDNPYVLLSGSSSSGALSWTLDFPVTDKRAYNFINRYNISYFFHDSLGYMADNNFVRSLQDSKSKVYDSGRMRVWTI